MKLGPDITINIFNKNPEEILTISSHHGIPDFQFELGHGVGPSLDDVCRVVNPPPLPTVQTPRAVRHTQAMTDVLVLRAVVVTLTDVLVKGCRHRVTIVELRVGFVFRLAEELGEGGGLLDVWTMELPVCV